jgi:hypothetical protein
MRLEKQLLLLGVVLAALMTMQLTSPAVQPAAAYSVGTFQFCWGKNLPPREGGQGPWWCGEEEWGYVKEVAGSGNSGSVCVEARPLYNGRACSAGPLQGAYLTIPYPNGVLGNGWIENNNKSKWNTVYGSATFVKAPEEPPPPPPPSGTWHYENMDASQILGDPTLSSPYPGALDIFARGLDSNLCHGWASNGPWSPWENVSAATGSGTIASSPGSVSWSSNRVDIVARMSNGTVGHWYHNGAWHYENLGGSITGDPDIASASENHLNLFARSTSGALVQKAWDGASWSGWQDVSAIVGSGPISSGVGAVATSVNTLDVVARMPAGNIGVFHWGGTGAWSFESLYGQILEDPDVSSVGGGAANVYAKGLDGNLWQQWRVGSGWSGWQNISALTGGVQIASGPGAASWNGTRVDVVGRETDETVGHWWYG